jgi:nucleoside-diphosphate-sugar epimerase
MEHQRILVTGASGCLGHYISEALIQETNHELFLLVRDPAKLKLNLQARPGITVLQGDMLDLEPLKELLPTLNRAILTATAWGGPDTYRVNVEQTHALMAALNPEVCEQILYFSTASILSRQLEPLPEAETLGHDYIRSKFQCLQQLPTLPLAERITTLFPTLVFGGDTVKPCSHLTGGLPMALQWSWLARFFKGEGSFNFIHGRDVALMVLKLLEEPEKYWGQRLVLGQSEVSVDQFIDSVCQFQSQKIWFQFDLSPQLTEMFIKLFRVQMAPWDYFCLQTRYLGFEHPYNPQTFGQEPHCASLQELFALTLQDLEAKPG